MTPDNPLLRAVIAEPDDDTLRLAAADWFGESGDEPRAEFVRVQVELARGVEDRGRRVALEVRQRDLLVSHETEWANPLAGALGCRPGVWGGWVFRRGFAEYFRLTSGRVLAFGARLAALTPLRELNVEGPLSDAAAELLIGTPDLHRLRWLHADLGRVSPGVRRRFRRHFAALLAGG